MLFQHVHQLINIACLVFCTCASMTSVGGAKVNMTTTHGVVTGTVVPGNNGESDVNVFYGIPFAEPPVGDLRFKAPECAKTWQGARDATKLPNSCWQAIDTSFDQFPGVEMWNPNTPRSEDCLYLNAWIPTTSTNKTIMVWIFGGGFWAGTTTLAVYDALKLAARNDVIVVSIAYRVGALGYLYADSADAPGNMGMLDQVLALKWIKHNAVHMGGNPSSITLFGESAGAASVGYHLLSPLSRDLFNRGIMLSSSPLVNWGVQSLKTAKQRFRLLAEKMGCPYSKKKSVLVACLRKTNASDLANTQFQVVSGLYFDAPFALVVDQFFLMHHPEVLVEKGEIKEADVLAGVVKNEGIYWLLYGFPDVFQKRELNPVNRSQFLDVVPGILAQYKMAERERRRYKESTNWYDDDDDDYVFEYDPRKKDVLQTLSVVEYNDGIPPLHRTDYLNALDAMSGDILFKCSVRDYCEEHCKHKKGNVFMYSFEHRISTNPWPTWLGVAHGYEIEVVMGLPFLHPGNYTDEERVLSDRTMQYFTNFAKHGDPNVGTTNVACSDWKQFEQDSQYYHILNLEDSSSDGLRFGPSKFWHDDVPLVTNSKLEVDYDTSKQCPDTDNVLILTGPTLPVLLALIMSVIGVQLWMLRP